jgi:hypothetical protein
VLGGQLFASHTKLQALSLSGNELSGFEPGIFRAFGSTLSTLDLSLNRIQELRRGVLDPLSALQALDVSGNRLGAGDFDAQLFEGLTSLRSAVWFTAACPAGYGSAFANDRKDSSLCLRCPTGTHKFKGDSSLLGCGPCAAGSVDADSDPSTPCEACSSGTYVPAGSAGPCASFRCSNSTVDDDNDPATSCVIRPTAKTKSNDGAGSTTVAAVLGTLLFLLFLLVVILLVLWRRKPGTPHIFATEMNELLANGILPEGNLIEPPELKPSDIASYEVIGQVKKKSLSFPPLLIGWMKISDSFRLFDVSPFSSSWLLLLLGFFLFLASSSSWLLPLLGFFFLLLLPLLLARATLAWYAWELTSA